MALLANLVKRIEDNDSLDKVSEPVAGVVGKATSGDSIKQALSGGWLGHQLHPLLTDIPIGTWMSATALDILGSRDDARAARRLVGLGILSSVPTAATGASDWVDTYGGEQRVGLVHALSNVAAVALQSTSYVARRRGHRYTGIVLSLAGLGTALGAGYLGGHLSFELGVGVNHTAFEFPSSDWTDVAAEDDLEAERPLRAMAGDVPVMVVRNRGQIHALSATCVHAGGPLDEGEIRGDCVVCPWHQSHFRLRDGAVKRGPAAVAQPAWEVRVIDGRVEVRAAA